MNILDSWIVNDRPTTIMGDMNMDFSEDCKLNKFLKKKDCLESDFETNFESRNKNFLFLPFSLEILAESFLPNEHDF